MINAIGRDIPDYLPGYGALSPFKGAFATLPAGRRYAPNIKSACPGRDKLVNDLETLFKKIPITNGMTLSFHHHFRNGDFVVNMVLDVAAKLGISDLHLAVTALFDVHKPLIEHMKNGVVTSLYASGLYGSVAQAVSNGVLAKPAVLHTHGGRARAIQSGQQKIDVAFIAAPAVDEYGNITGVLGPAACGALGYAFSDADYADTVVAVSDNLVSFPLFPISIPQTKVDYVVLVDSIGDPKGIISGSTRLTRDPIDLVIAEKAAEVIKASGLLQEGFSFQTGAGGASLAAAHFVGQMMEKEEIRGSFAVGGITGYIAKMLEKGLFKTIFDVQSFDQEAIRSLAGNTNHLEISADFYANPFNSGCIVNKLDTVILGATEVDIDFNVNVVSGSDGVIMGGSGGHSDTAAGAKLAIIATKLIRSRLPIIVDRVFTATTPGETIDVVVTERGIAVNPRRQELKERLQVAGLPVKDIHELKKLTENISGLPNKAINTGRVVALVEYRDGTIIDIVRQKN